MAVQQVAMSLVQAAKQGDASAFEILLDPLIEPGYRLACGMLHDHQAAEDAVQESAIKAWRKLHQLRQGSDMKPWFLGIVANQCRSTRRSSWWSLVRPIESETAEEEQSDAILNRIQLRRALLSMDEKKRLVLVLHWYLDLTLEEVATATGASVHAVESRLQRGIRELRQRMEDQRGR